jgi:hypothetical protein
VSGVNAERNIWTLPHVGGLSPDDDQPNPEPDMVPEPDGDPKKFVLLPLPLPDPLPEPLPDPMLTQGEPKNA